ncbi:hypothetical protein ACQRBF_01795 [Peptoniphilaceae bacterium SGI.131]
MKKLFILILCVIFLSGCGGQKNTGKEDSVPSDSSTPSTDSKNSVDSKDSADSKDSEGSKDSKDSTVTTDDSNPINYKEYTEYEEEDSMETDSAERERKEKENILSRPLPDVNLLMHNGFVTPSKPIVERSYSDFKEAVRNPYAKADFYHNPEELGEFFTHDLLADKKAKGTIIFSWNLYKKTSKEFSYKDIQNDPYNTAALHFNSDGRVWIKMPENEIESNNFISTYTEGKKETIKGGYSVSYEINPVEKNGKVLFPGGTFVRFVYDDEKPEELMQIDAPAERTRVYGELKVKDGREYLCDPCLYEYSKLPSILGKNGPLSAYSDLKYYVEFCDGSAKPPLVVTAYNSDIEIKIILSYYGAYLAPEFVQGEMYLNDFVNFEMSDCYPAIVYGGKANLSNAALMTVIGKHKPYMINMDDGLSACVGSTGDACFKVRSKKTSVDKESLRELVNKLQEIDFNELTNDIEVRSTK